MNTPNLKEQYQKIINDNIEKDVECFEFVKADIHETTNVEPVTKYAPFVLFKIFGFAGGIAGAVPSAILNAIQLNQGLLAFTNKGLMFLQLTALGKYKNHVILPYILVESLKVIEKYYLLGLGRQLEVTLFDGTLIILRANRILYGFPGLSEAVDNFDKLFEGYKENYREEEEKLLENIAEEEADNGFEDQENTNVASNIQSTNGSSCVMALLMLFALLISVIVEICCILY